MENIASLLSIRIGDDPPLDAKQIKTWQKMISNSTIEFQTQAKRIGIKGEAVDGAAPFVFGMFDEIHNSAQDIVKNRIEQTNLVQKIRVK